MKASGGFVVLTTLLLSSGMCAGDDFFDKNDFKKAGFEKRLYYGLEKTDGITPQQKESINQLLKEFQSQKEKQMNLNVKKFQFDDLPEETVRALVSDTQSAGYRGRASLLSGIHKVLNQKQREQFIKKFQGMID